MNQTQLPPIILGGDPFSQQFRFLYRKDRVWKLHDEDYCLSIMRSAYEAGCRGFDLSFPENVRLLKRLMAEVDEPVLGFGNPTWNQGVMFNGRFIFFIRDRILKSLVDRIWPRPVANLVRTQLAKEAVLVFGYDGDAEPLTDKEIAGIYLDEDIFRQRLSIFKGVCQYIYFGGSDADYLVSLGRMDLVEAMLSVVRSEGFEPMLLCQYPSLIIPAVDRAGIGVKGYVAPLNRIWSWFDHQSTLEAVLNTDKSVIAFMALSSPELHQDISGALNWLYDVAGVDSILFGTATPEHARETTEIALKLHEQLECD
ncbi:hypothetical protein KQH56_01305 [bacterium]|nr:hypothetical protein [bacterium]